jgi:hypothetical protein
MAAVFVLASRRLSALGTSVIAVRRILVLSLPLVLTASVAFGEPPPCLLTSQKPMVLAELYFGRDIGGRGPVTDAEWSGFVDRIVARQFPDGFTVHDGDGEWLNAATRRVVRERTKILTIAVERSAGLAARIEAVVDAYKRQFRQISVGVMTTEACARF